jgi:membrane protease YdiL (CAAX protease family)
VSQPGKDVLRGAGPAAVIGGCGLGLYYLAFKAGINEEVLVVGYLLTRLELLGFRPARAVAVSAVLRGSYHLHQGIGPFIGNVIMGVIFGTLFVRWRRTNPMIIAHTLINAVAFIGYTLLAAHVSWLP